MADLMSELVLSSGHDGELIRCIRRVQSSPILSVPEPPTLLPGLRSLIADGLELPYRSVSSLNAIPTDNHYQSVLLDGHSTTGFRSSRRQLLDLFDLSGKRVLDLGSNLGELSRAARDAGASLVDGYEYDPFFVELSRLLAVYNRYTRVSFYERDITKADSFPPGLSYDVVLAFSVFVYLGDVLHCIGNISELLVLETHGLHDDLEPYYLSQICPHYPYYAIIEETEWGIRDQDPRRRLVICFGKSKSSIAKFFDQWVARAREPAYADHRPCQFSAACR